MEHISPKKPQMLHYLKKFGAALRKHLQMAFMAQSRAEAYRSAAIDPRGVPEHTRKELGLIGHRPEISCPEAAADGMRKKVVECISEAPLSGAVTPRYSGHGAAPQASAMCLSQDFW